MSSCPFNSKNIKVTNDLSEFFTKIKASVAGPDRLLLDPQVQNPNHESSLQWDTSSSKSSDFNMLKLNSHT